MRDLNLWSHPILVFFLTLALTSASLLSAQDPAASQPHKPKRELAEHVASPKANASDVDTIEDIIHAFYSVLSTPAGGKINRDRLYSLFIPDGRIAIGLPAEPSRSADLVLETLEQLADSADAYTTTKGFFDHNVANRIQHFGVMAQVYSTYESRSQMGDTKPMVRGIKSFELLQSAGRWYIVQVYWDTERTGNPIPKAYLHSSSMNDIKNQ